MKAQQHAQYYISGFRFCAQVHLFLTLVSLALLITMSITGWLNIVWTGAFFGIHAFDIPGLVFAFRMYCAMPSASDEPGMFFNNIRGWTGTLKFYRVWLIIMSFFWSCMSCCALAFGIIGAMWNSPSYYGYNSYYGNSWYYQWRLLYLFNVVLFTTIMLTIITGYESYLCGKLRNTILGLPFSCCCGTDVCTNAPGDMSGAGCCDCGSGSYVPPQQYGATVGAGSVQYGGPAQSYVVAAEPVQVAQEVRVADEVKRVDTNSRHVSVSGISQVSSTSAPSSDSVRKMLAEYYYENDPAKLSNLDSLVAFINKEGIEAFNNMVRPIYGYGLGESKVSNV